MKLLAYMLLGFVVGVAALGYLEEGYPGWLIATTVILVAVMAPLVETASVVGWRRYWNTRSRTQDAANDAPRPRAKNSDRQNHSAL